MNKIFNMTGQETRRERYLYFNIYILSWYHGEIVSESQGDIETRDEKVLKVKDRQR